MNDPLEYRRKRLMFRCWHRGIRELDLIFGRFAQAHLAVLSGEQLDRLEALMENSDPDVYCWLTGRQAVPAEFDNDVFAKLKAFIKGADVPRQQLLDRIGCLSKRVFLARRSPEGIEDETGMEDSYGRR